MSKKSQYQLKLKVTVHEINEWTLPDNKPIFIVFEVRREGGEGGREGGRERERERERKRNLSRNSLEVAFCFHPQ